MRMIHTKYGYVSREEAMIDGELERYFKEQKRKERVEQFKLNDKKQIEKGDIKHDKHKWI